MKSVPTIYNMTKRNVCTQITHHGERVHQPVEVCQEMHLHHGTPLTVRQAREVLQLQIRVLWLTAASSRQKLRDS
jgi:hypothetical protein